MKRTIHILLLTTLLIGFDRVGAQEFALHDGDRVVFYGDSITAQRLYTRFVEDFVLTRYPALHISFWNAGVPGDNVYGGYTGDVSTRLKRDLFPHQPSVVTVMLGMNDGYYMAFNPKYFDNYKEGYHRLLDSIEAGAPPARLTLISTTPYDEVTHGTEFAGYNEVVSRHAAFAKELAATSHLGFSDFNRTESSLLRAGKQREPNLARLLIPDRIHPAEASHGVLAAALARSWNLSPVVSNVRLDAGDAKALVQENARVTDLTANAGTLAWTQVDNALPLPLPLDDGMVQFVLKISDLAEMDREMLRVDGLTRLRYALKIDGRLIASFSRQQLAEGVNLALYSTPMESQAKSIDAIELKRARLDEAHFLLAIEDPKAADAAEASKAIDEKDAALLAEQWKTAQPKPHHFELSPQ